MCGGGQVVLGPAFALLGLLVVIPLWAWQTRAASGSASWPLLGALVYLVVLISLTFFPLPLPRGHFEARCQFVHLVPFETIGLALQRGPGSREFALLAGNILAFVPVGVLVPLLRPTARPWLTVLAAGVLLSLAVEVGQLLVSLVLGFPYREADVDDLIVNTVGAGVGWAVLVVGRRVSRALASGARLE